MQIVNSNLFSFLQSLSNTVCIVLSIKTFLRLFKLFLYVPMNYVDPHKHINEDMILIDF